jgi:hypothetical protein
VRLTQLRLIRDRRFRVTFFSLCRR